MSKLGYIPQNQRKKILLIGDDVRFTSGVAGVLREIVIGTSHKFNYRILGGAISHPDIGKKLDISEDTNKHANIDDADVFIYPVNGYGDVNILRHLIKSEKPDALIIMTDPRYYIWLFQIENEIRKKIPIIYLSIWDNLPAPLWNEPYYESCDGLMGISKQTHNIHKMVLGDKTKNKILDFVPHGINEKHFYPIEDKDKINKVKEKLFGNRQFDFVLMYNSRNIRRKQTSDILAAFKLFLDKLPKEKADKCALILHTQPIDEHGTNLYDVRDALFDEDQCNQILFSDMRITTDELNLIYNISDAVILLSSNEGWGLSLTEAMMCGKPIIANVTGGMQDQMRFENENGEWINFDENFCSNHFGTYKKCGEWAIPIFPSNISIQGSVPTPYIYDDRVDFREASNAILRVYSMGDKERKRRGKLGREWALSDESMMSASNMCKNVINHIDKVLATWEPKPKFELIKIVPLKRKHLKHELIY